MRRRGTALQPLVGLHRAVSEAVEEGRHKMWYSLAPVLTRRNSGFASAVMAAVPEAVEEDTMRDSPAIPPPVPRPAGALGDANQRAARRAPGCNQRPAPRAYRRPGPRPGGPGLDLVTIPCQVVIRLSCLTYFAQA